MTEREKTLLLLAILLVGVGMLIGAIPGGVVGWRRGRPGAAYAWGIVGGGLGGVISFAVVLAMEKSVPISFTTDILTSFLIFIVCPIVSSTLCAVAFVRDSRR